MQGTQGDRSTTDFSLVLGGPLYQLFVRSRLCGTTLELVRRRILFAVAITWLPLLLLSIADGSLLGNERPSFLFDIESHIRFLFALPLLIYAELVVHQRVRLVVASFITRGIIAPKDMPRFEAALESAARVRNSLPLEFAVLALAFTVGHWIWKSEMALGTTTWYATAGPTGTTPTLPGFWFQLISIPLGQFILLRWYLRIGNWAWLLWRVSRLDLILRPTHPDRAGGIGFLGRSTFAFGPLLFAQGAVLAGVIANRIFFEGDSLLSFKMTIATLVCIMVLVVLGPMGFFIGGLARSKRRGLTEYGELASKYTEEFDVKWVQGAAQNEALLGSADIQSLADLGNSYTVVREMRLVPFSRDDVILLVVMTAAPLLPLVLTIVPIDKILAHVATAIF